MNITTKFLSVNNRPNKSMTTKLNFEIVPVTPFEQNCSVIWCTQTKLAAVTDPGGDLDKIHHTIERHGLTLDKILITHAHLDHAGGTAEFSRSNGIPIIGPHKADQFWIDAMPEQCQRFGFKGEKFVPDQWLNHGDKIKLGELTFDVAHCPGHTPGHVVFIEKSEQFSVVGDVIFKGSIGRSDFPQGNQADLINSIRSHLFTLDDEIQFIPGHGPMSTFGYERKTNPFVADQKFG